MIKNLGYVPMFGADRQSQNSNNSTTRSNNVKNNPNNSILVNQSKLSKNINRINWAAK